MQQFQRANGWLLLLILIQGLFQQNLMGGLIQIEKGSWPVLALLALISLSSVKEAWIKKWTWMVSVLYLLLAVFSFTAPITLGYRLQPFEALLCLGLSTWGIYEALKTPPPTVPTA